MESTRSKRDILQDFALIYIAFAHGTDAELADNEVEIIAERMRDWNYQADRDALVNAIKAALREYLEDEDSRSLEAAILHVKSAAPTAVKQVILDDLMDIAMADDVFKHAEGSFIKSLEDAWELHPVAGDAEPTSFSVVDQSEQYGGWTALHDLALIYLTLAHSTDHELTTEEVDAITGKISEWMPDAADSDVMLVVQGAMNVYAQGPDKRAFAESVDAVRRLVPEHQRQSLLDDLEAVANADGGISDNERVLIDRLREAWDRETAA